MTKEFIWIGLAAYLAIMNLAGFLIAAHDKRRAVRGGRRYPKKPFLPWHFLEGRRARICPCAAFAIRPAAGASCLGLPAIMLAEAAGLWAAWRFLL
jgi:hypothetical protein